MLPLLRSAAALFALAAVPDATTPPLTLAGPPWIGIEYPVNPFNQEYKDALLLVHVYHHAAVAYYPLTGTAEGLVDGQRKSEPLAFVTTSTPGVYALNFKKPADGRWVLVIRIGKGEELGGATAVVRLGRDGAVSEVKVPSRQEGRYVLPRSVSSTEIDAMLREG
jgi:hypothetical protein